jgi:L-methionine (R)-S-oxide reductase
MSRLEMHQRKLRELAGFEVTGKYEDNLSRLTCIVAELLAARRVSMMLLDTASSVGARLKLAALFGKLPESAWSEEQAPGQGIAGQVLESGVCVRVTHIGRSIWKQHARHSDEPGGFLICPIILAGLPAGVLNVSLPIDRTSFSNQDQANAELAALMIGRALQVGRLDRLLDSRLAQMAFALEGTTDAMSMISLSTHNPDKVAKILARAFYRELRHCGFSANQIIHAAGEIISELTNSLNRHKKRLAGE